MAEAEPVLAVEGLTKTFRTPFTRRKVTALRGVTFAVQRGEIFGFVGPNGAGKTTTIRTLMGLIRPTSGRVRMLSRDVPSRAARERVGFLPESPYFYDYLTVAELLDLTGRLFGLDGATRKKRANDLIDRVGLSGTRGQNLKKFSKGMLQRAGLAQALMNEPELVVLDEPMSGLDPIGRKDVRDLIVALRDAGTTVFFSTHILSDVEAITDRVAIIAKGAVQAEGKPSELVAGSVKGIDVALHVSADVDAAAVDALVEAGSAVVRKDDALALTLPPDVDLDAWLARARDAKLKLVSVVPRHETLEARFLRDVAAAEAAAAEEKAS